MISDAGAVAVHDLGWAGLSRWFPPQTLHHLAFLHHEIVLPLTVRVPPAPWAILLTVRIVYKVFDFAIWM